MTISKHQLYRWRRQLFGDETGLDDYRNHELEISIRRVCRLFSDFKHLAFIIYVMSRFSRIISVSVQTLLEDYDWLRSCKHEPKERESYFSHLLCFKTTPSSLWDENRQLEKKRERTLRFWYFLFQCTSKLDRCLGCEGVGYPITQHGSGLRRLRSYKIWKKKKRSTLGIHKTKLLLQ